MRTIVLLVSRSNDKDEEVSTKKRKWKRSALGEKTYRPLRNVLDLSPHVLFQFVGALGIGRSLVVVFAAIVEDQLRVSDKVFRGRIEVFFVFFFHGAEVHGLLDDFVVIGDFVAVDWLCEGPGRGVVLDVIEKV